MLWTAGLLSDSALAGKSPRDIAATQRASVSPGLSSQGHNTRHGGTLVTVPQKGHPGHGRGEGTAQC